MSEYFMANALLLLQVIPGPAADKDNIEFYYFTFHTDPLSSVDDMNSVCNLISWNRAEWLQGRHL